MSNCYIESMSCFAESFWIIKLKTDCIKLFENLTIALVFPNIPFRLPIHVSNRYQYLILQIFALKCFLVSRFFFISFYNDSSLSTLNNLTAEQNKLTQDQFLLPFTRVKKNQTKLSVVKLFGTIGKVVC